MGELMRANAFSRQLVRPYDGSPAQMVAVALSNKMARTIWAMMTREEDYRLA
ncbi:hypothetical protein [Sphingobium yanoikuyae]|jgi:transposase|uniref:hypothetical protein n=1 Tax=Sphingobium yanoikuyae TaxID=13690 RepID=UPI0035C78961